MMKKIIILIISLFFIGQASANAIYYLAKGDGVNTFTTYTGITCTNLGASSPCTRYDEGSLRVDMDLDTVKYQVQNSQGTWRYIQYDISNPTNLIPSPVSNPKSLVWNNLYANNTNLRYVMQSHGIKLDIRGNGTPPSNYFNFTYTFSSGITYRMQGEEILFMDTVTGEPLWLIKYPTMQVNGTDVPLTFKKYGNQISIHAPDLFTNPEYNFSAGWELDPSTQLGSTIYISDRQNLTQVSADINNVSALQNLGGGEWLLNANLINNNTANTFYMNDSDVTWLKINSTNISGTPTYWYYLSNGKTEINNTKITSWNTTLGDVEQLPVLTWARSAVYASGTSSKMNISNSNLSYLGYSAVNMYGVYYATSSNNQIINNSFLQNFRGIYLQSSSNNTLTSNIVTSNISYGIYLYSSSNNNTITSNTVTANTSYGIYLSSSSNNNLTSNTFNTNSTTTTIGDIIVSTSPRNNVFINTSFTNPRKITFYNAILAEFNQSQDFISFINTNVSIARTTNRSIVNWNQTNITFTETFTGATQATYSAAGLLSNSDYRIYNGTTIDYNLTTDANGVLPNFRINFTATIKTISINQIPLPLSTVNAQMFWDYENVSIVFNVSNADNCYGTLNGTTINSCSYPHSFGLLTSGTYVYLLNSTYTLTGRWSNTSVIITIDDNFITQWNSYTNNENNSFNNTPVNMQITYRIDLNNETDVTYVWYKDGVVINGTTKNNLIVIDTLGYHIIKVVATMSNGVYWAAEWEIGVLDGWASIIEKMNELETKIDTLPTKDDVGAAGAMGFLGGIMGSVLIIAIIKRYWRA